MAKRNFIPALAIVASAMALSAPASAQLLGGGGGLGGNLGGSLGGTLGGTLGNPIDPIGGTIGSALVAAGVVISKGKDLEGHALALAASSLLLAAMGARFAKTGKFMPAGAAASVGALTALYNGKKVGDWM